MRRSALAAAVLAAVVKAQRLRRLAARPMLAGVAAQARRPAAPGKLAGPPAPGKLAGPPPPDKAGPAAGDLADAATARPSILRQLAAARRAKSFATSRQELTCNTS